MTVSDLDAALVEYDLAVLALKAACEAPSITAILAREVGVDPMRVQAGQLWLRRLAPEPGQPTGGLAGGSGTT